MLEEQLIRDWPLEHWRRVTVVVGVSGGPDSVALLRALQRLASSNHARLVVAHFDHRWRDESEEDAHFVSQLAATLQVEARIGRASTAAQTTGGAGREAAARGERFAFFTEVGRACGARYLALGHTHDDHVETILHRVLRGTGPAGLAGIPICRPWLDACGLVHPLRNVSRRTVIEYLKELRQPFRHDASNTDTSLTRNRIRHELLPKLRSEYNSQIDDCLARLGRWAAQYQEWMTAATAELAEATVRRESDGTIVVDTTPLASAYPLQIAELFRWIWAQERWPQRSMSWEAWQRITEFVLHNQPALILPEGVSLRRENDQLILTPPPTA